MCQSAELYLLRMLFWQEEQNSVQVSCPGVQLFSDFCQEQIIDLLPKQIQQVFRGSVVAILPAEEAAEQGEHLAHEQHVAKMPFCLIRALPYKYMISTVLACALDSSA